MFLYRVPTIVVALVIAIWVVGATSEGVRQSVGAVQAALLAFVAVLLAFGLSMGVDRYEGRRQSSP